MSNLDIAKKYCNDILTDVIPACIYIKQACTLFLSNLQRIDLIFDEDEVDRVVTFINQLELSEQQVQTFFELQPWQTFIICGIYGFYFKATNTRKVNTVFLELPRKNGKSQLITALTIYHLIFEKDSQVIVSANSREQAKNVDFKKVKAYCNQLDPDKILLKQYYTQIKFQNNEFAYVRWKTSFGI